MSGLKRNEAGFTLTEVLVAVVIFALLSAMAMTMLTTSLRTRDIHTDQMDAIREVDRARALLRGDIGQLVMRPFRGPEGISDGLVFAADIEGTDPFETPRSGEPREILVLTRTGWANPGGINRRSTLQRVAWVYDGERLVRRAWAYPDAARDAEPSELEVLTGITELRLEVLIGNRWVDNLVMSAGGEGYTIPPRAVRLSYESETFGALEHLLLTPNPEPGL